MWNDIPVECFDDDYEIHHWNGFCIHVLTLFHHLLRRYPGRYEAENSEASEVAQETHMLNIGVGGEIYREKRPNSRFAYDPYADQLCLYDVMVHPSVYHFVYNATDGKKELFCKRVLQHINRNYEESLVVDTYKLPKIFKEYKGEMHLCYVKRDALLQ
jgi:hypothetical protein